MKRLVCAAAALLLSAAAANAAKKSLEMWFIDVEGGQATLIVAPSGETMLVDTGWRGYNGRDTNRIVDAMKAAHVKKLDFVFITHYHVDHVGGAPQLAERVPIGTWIDHGPNMEDSKITREDYASYQQEALPKGQHLVVKPGDTVPLKGVDVTVVAANGDAIQSPLTDAGKPNAACATTPKKELDTTENARSAGFLLRYGAFRFVDLGDLTWNKEMELMCPVNRIGTVDVFLVSHHGMDLSNSPALVDALHPRVAIMDNGARKGGSAEAWQTVHDSPGLEDLWQLHYAVGAGKDHNSPDSFTANLYENCEGKPLRLTAHEDGSFTVVNTRNQYEKTYQPR